MKPVRAWTPDLDARLLDMRAAGTPWREIGRELGFAENTVTQRGHTLRHRNSGKQGGVQHRRTLAGLAPLPTCHPIAWEILTGHKTAVLSSRKDI